MLKVHRLLMLGLVALAGVQGAAAQPYEFFGGYTVASVKPGDNRSTTLNGWNTSVTAYLRSRYAITADFAGYYGQAHPTATPSLDPVSVRQHSFLVGPQVRVLRLPRMEMSVRALIGVATGYVPSSAFNTDEQTRLASTVGANFDINLSRRVAFRVSPGWYVTSFGHNQTQNNYRVSFGPVIRLGGLPD